MRMSSFFIRTIVVVFVVAIAATRSPAPVIEAPEPTPSAAPPAPPPPPQATEEKPSATPKTKRKKAEPESKPKKETLAVSEPTKPAVSQPAKPAAASSRAFAGTWKGMMPDGRGWSIVISPDETTVTAFGPGEFQRPGAAHVDGNTISWSSLAAHQKNSWQLKLQPGGRHAEVTAFHVSGNMSATFDKTN